MLTKRIIPCLDVTACLKAPDLAGRAGKAGRVVKGVKFVQLRDAGDPVELAKYYNEQGADELVFLDITASSDKRDIMLDVVARTSEEVFIPFTVGGGIYDIAWIRKLLKNGADKVSLNTAAVKNHDFVREAADTFGTQCIVVAIDAKKRPTTNDQRPAWEVYTHGGRTPTGIDAVEWAQKAVQLGAGEILLTSMDRDGTQIGYDLELTRLVSQAVPIPVIASGGAGKVEHIHEAFVAGAADAALLASLLHYRTLTIAGIKQFLKEKGVPVRAT